MDIKERVAQETRTLLFGIKPDIGYIEPIADGFADIVIPLVRADMQREIGSRPRIVCLCGSTRFKDAFTKAQLEETLAGKIVLTIGCNMKSDTEIFGHLSEADFNATKIKLDELHKRKIDLADEVFILNVGGYVGESTSSEIAYAENIGRPIYYLEDKSGTFKAEGR